MTKTKTLLVLFFLILFSSISYHSNAQFWKKKNTKKEESTKQKKILTKSDSLKISYDKLLKNAVTQDGMFKIHKVKNKFYFEIPRKLMNREFLISSVVSGVGTTFNIQAGRMPRDPKMVKLSADENNLYFLEPEVTHVCDENSEIYPAFKRNHKDMIWKAYEIKAFGKDSSSYVISLDDIFISSQEEFNPFIKMVPPLDALINFTGPFDSKRSKIKSTKSFKDNVRVKSIMTYTVTGNSYTVEMTRNFVLLDEKPSQMRYADDRIGYFESRKFIYSGEKALKTQKIIHRWNLQPSDIDAYKRGDLVEPIKPIVWYVDPAIPSSYRSYIKQGIEDWQIAFEEIGFKNAIVAKDYPTKEDNPNFDPDDIKYNCYKYCTTSEKNSMGPSWIDPRSGEIIAADVYFYSNVISLLHEWRFVQTAQVDERMRTTKFNNKLIGESLRNVAAHEIGHTLGLMHNFLSSYAYPVDSLRSPKFTKEYGTTPSIMDYARYNYIAQPGDKDLKLTPPILGVYDKFAIKYGYKYIPNVKKAVDEESILNDWLLEHRNNPMYTYLNPYTHNTLNPASQTEALGDDAIKASKLGIRNLKYITKNLSKWILKDNDKYDDLKSYHNLIKAQFSRYIGHVQFYLGGEYSRPTVYGDGLKPHKFVSRKKQKEALNFILESIEEFPYWFNDKNVAKYAGPQAQNVRYVQGLLFQGLFSKFIAHGIVKGELEDKDAYTYTQYNNDIFNHIWEKTNKGVMINSYDMFLQNCYIEELGKTMQDSRYVINSPLKISEDVHIKNIDDNEMSLSSFIANPVIAPAMGEVAYKTYKLLEKAKKTQNSKLKSHYEALYFKLKIMLDK